MALPPAQPLFEAFEEGLQDYAPHLVAEGSGALFTTRLVYRSLNTVVITIIAASVPYFSLFGGLIGALSFWPLAGEDKVLFLPACPHSRGAGLQCIA